MILWLFCIIIFYEISAKIDTNHNGIDLCTVSPWWPCGMMPVLCVNGHEFLPGSVLEHGRWDTKISGGSRNVVSLVPEIQIMMSLPVQSQ